ncbi:RNA polymerase subunit sigma [Bifidobacterium callitrichos]|uniref:RNA polymerase subunit sigma n=2 Tax=Bifidobacterium callitrichos TaxID=762209 RepID=A0A2T3GCX6_9BIFI|nr:sigma-70 family RNA polymerase sigma factor [Bifidobacterium callitrichos]PST47346.1 RNA polymerase subunit sigma [Bifidobacterium callitrichos]
MSRLQWADVTTQTNGTATNETLAERRERFERLAMPALNALYRQAMRLTNNPEDAQDLVQDTFEKGFKAFDSFQEGTNFEAWMTTIERNTYFNQYAKAKRRPQRANDADGEYDDWDIYEASEHTSDGLKSAEDEYLDAFAPEEIMQALSKLSPERRQVFIDAAIDGKSYQQVADEQGVKIGTVMSRLNRARTQLKRELASYAREHGYGTQLPSGSPKARSGKSGNASAVSTPSGSPKAKSSENPLRGLDSGDNEDDASLRGRGIDGIDEAPHSKRRKEMR